MKNEEADEIIRNADIAFDRLIELAEDNKIDKDYNKRIAKLHERLSKARSAIGLNEWLQNIKPWQMK